MSQEQADARAPDAMLLRFVERARAKMPAARDDEVAFVAETMRGDFVRNINDHLRLFKQERNGLSIWRAIQECTHHGEPIPDVIAQKLARWGAELEKANNARDMVRALELTGDKGAYKGPKHLNAIEKRREVASQVELVKGLYRLNNADAIKLVARNSHGRLSHSKVAKDYYSYFAKPSQRATPEGQDLASVMRRFRGDD